MTTQKLREKFQKLGIEAEKADFVNPDQDLGDGSAYSAERNAFDNLYDKQKLLYPDLDRDAPNMEVSDSLPDQYFWPEPKEAHEKKEVYSEDVYRGLSDKEFGPKLKAYLKFNNGMISLDKEIMNLMKVSRLNAENANAGRGEKISNFTQYLESWKRINFLYNLLLNLYPKSAEMTSQATQLYFEALQILVDNGSKAWFKEAIKITIPQHGEDYNKKLVESAEILRDYGIVTGQTESKEKPLEKNNSTESSSVQSASNSYGAFSFTPKSSTPVEFDDDTDLFPGVSVRTF